MTLKTIRQLQKEMELPNIDTLLETCVIGLDTAGEKESEMNKTSAIFATLHLEHQKTFPLKTHLITLCVLQSGILFEYNPFSYDSQNI